MASSRRYCDWIVEISLGPTAVGLVLGILFVMTAHAQTFKLIHTFGAAPDGNTPYAGLTMDAAGNLYGTTCSGGAKLYGTVFKLTHKNSGWVLTTLYSFPTKPDDGVCPRARVVFGPDGALYGTTYAGGGTQASCFSAGFSGCGTVFKLTPPATFCRAISCPWTETVLYHFQGGRDGQQPTAEVIFDHSGNIYGTTFFGVTQGSCYGGFGCGSVYKLTHSNGTWTESILYSFTGGSDGGEPYAGVILDGEGNLYGTNSVTNDSYGGTVFELTPSGSGSVENTLLSFYGSNCAVYGCYPFAGLIFDNSGNLYGATSGDNNPAGAVFEMMPSMGSWETTVLYPFSGPGVCGFFGCGPLQNLVMDAGGNLYGTTYGEGAYGAGSAFKLTSTGGVWAYTSLHDFCAGGYPPCSDGWIPVSNLVFDANGNVYGTTSGGGNPSCGNGCGVVFEITPN